MGIVASQARYLMLTARKNDLEFAGQQLNQSRTQLANVQNQLFNEATNLDPESAAAIKIQLKLNSVQALDQALELQLKRVDTQQKAVSTEMESVTKLIQKNVESTFKTFA
jgi:hypothetical protein